jgi:hypothetical protein
MSQAILTSESRANFRNLYGDVFWYGILGGSTMAFVAVYAARLGASSFQVSLLTIGPAIVNLLFSLPAGRWLEGKPLVRVSLWSSLWQRSGYLLFILLPLFFTSNAQVWALAGITLLMSLPGTLLAISFNAVFAGVVAPEWRAQVVGRRNALLAFSMISTSLLCGQLLDRVTFPYNYQIVFALGALGAGMSSLHLGRLRLRGEPPVHLWSINRILSRSGVSRFLDAMRNFSSIRLLSRADGRALLRLDLLRTTFGTFLISCFVFYMCQYVSIPIYPVFNVNVLRLTDGQISLGNALFYTTMMLASFGLGALSRRLGHRRVLITGSLIFGLYPLLIGLAWDATLFWLASIAGGFAWGITSGGLLNRLMERTPEDDRPAYMTLHNLALNLGILLGSLAGPFLAARLGLRDAILTSAGLRFVAGLLFILWA